MARKKTTKKRATRAEIIQKNTVKKTMSKGERKEAFVERMRLAREAKAEKSAKRIVKTATVPKKKTVKVKAVKKKTAVKTKKVSIKKKTVGKERKRTAGRKKTAQSKTKKAVRKKAEVSKKNIRTKSKRKTKYSAEERERLQQAKRVLRSLQRPTILPKAVIHTNKLHLKEILDEVPEQALIEHWEALNELKNKGVEIKHTNVPIGVSERIRTIELDEPVSSHARHFASRHGLIVRERRGLFHRTIEHLLG
jgi:hypothetical protein